MFTYFRFHTVVFRVLSFLFRPYTSTLYSGLLAVEDFPGVFDLLRRIKVGLTGPETDYFPTGGLEFGSQGQHGTGRRWLNPRHAFRN